MRAPQERPFPIPSVCSRRKHAIYESRRIRAARFARLSRLHGLWRGKTRPALLDADEASSRQIIRRALEAGVNFFDTAIVYQGGTSEQYLGRALRDFARREDVVVATKFPPRTAQEIAGGVSAREHISRMIDASLQNLGMDHVDLYIYHMWDYATPLYEIMDGLDRVVRSGKARYIGISNCFAYQLAKANALAEKEGFANSSPCRGITTSFSARKNAKWPGFAARTISP